MNGDLADYFAPRLAYNDHRYADDIASGDFWLLFCGGALELITRVIGTMAVPPVARSGTSSGKRQSRAKTLEEALAR